MTPSKQAAQDAVISWCSAHVVSQIHNRHRARRLNGKAVARQKGDTKYVVLHAVWALPVPHSFWDERRGRRRSNRRALPLRRHSHSFGVLSGRSVALGTRSGTQTRVWRYGATSNKFLAYNASTFGGDNLHTASGGGARCFLEGFPKQP
jgi:hypothetical protein